MNKRMLHVSGIILSIALVMLGTSAAIVASAKTIDLKLGHVSATTHPYHIEAELVAKDVYERTNGEVQIHVFPSNQLGQQREMVEGLQLGTLDIVFTSSAVLAQFAPKVQVIDLPYIFRDREHAYKVFDGPLAQEIYKGVESVGTYVTTWENGVRHFVNNVHQIKTPKDMEGLKLRVMENKVYIELAKMLGANPTPMAYGELYTALQQGTVDGADAPAGNIYTERFYEVLKYLCLDGHSYSPSIVLVSNNLAKKVGEKNAQIIIQTFKDHTTAQRDLSIKDEAEKLKLLKDSGLDIHQTTPEEKKLFMEAVKPVWEQFADVVGQDLIDKIVATQ